MVNLGFSLSAPILAILWLVIGWIWGKLGFESEQGIKYLGVGAFWLVFYSAFQIMANFFAGRQWASMLGKIGVYVGGTLAWLFAFVGAVLVIYEVMTE